MGYEVRPDIPIYIAALSPNMLQLAGEIGDGVLLWLCDPPYVRDVVIPEVTPRPGASGQVRSTASTSSPPCPPRSPPTGRPPSTAFAADLVTYLSLPFYRSMLERSGFEREISRFDVAMARRGRATRQGRHERRHARLAGRLGSADDVRAAVGRYRDAGATSPGVSPVPSADFEATLEAGAELI